ncbi:hypothetical protein OTB20_08550 [Streptomyces sp. H27-H1]|uniref:hypothetical protein n=1 Tax=Streptomyces sp. H27-H1 TaxID=2996461 RepID=UPI00226D96AB|nr:hypothetical protein [Streptomyces sp. H27-H1]MCY0926255.1 hypothetical protein [Streptomyces sp. H27-H1]
MALYEVTRTDNPGPRELINALVIAGGAAQARKAVAHLEGVTATNVVAVRVDVAGGPSLLAAYWDER